MINILDCTLRDGGYINSFDFGKKCIRDIVRKLTESRIEIIECGFLKSGEFDENKSLFGSVSMIEQFIDDPSVNNMYVAMIAYGDIPIEEVEPCNHRSVTGIRLTFHEAEIDEAFEYAGKLIEKGYKVFIQPVGTATYTDRALLNLIEKVNNIDPFAFYLVDTLGTMYKNDLLRMFYLVDNNLKPGIKVGFNSHNNLPLSFSNAQELILMNAKRDIIIDSSVFGMGRGAGNLCTELITQYINENIEDKYELIPILEIMDEWIMPIRRKFDWGYSAPYYIAAVNDCHPNYASALINRQTLCIRDINTIIRMIPDSKKHLFDKKLINELYIEYQSQNVDDTEVIKEIAQLCKDRKVLILAPGRSIIAYKEEIDQFIAENNPVIFAINYIPQQYRYDKIFMGNLKRFRSLDDAVSKINDKLICTSNISSGADICTVNYTSYLNDNEAISDNSGLMIINVLKRAGVNSLVLAGYDGFDDTVTKNYFDEKMITGLDYDRLNITNKAIIDYFAKAKKTLDIRFLTPTIYDLEVKNEKL